MKLFQTKTSGFVFAFGFDMLNRKPAPRLICWCDPATQAWDMLPTNQSGTYELPFEVDPEFIIDFSDTRVIAYQPGLCIELNYIGAPMVWACNILRAPAEISAAA